MLKCAFNIFNVSSPISEPYALTLSSGQANRLYTKHNKLRLTQVTYGTGYIVFLYGTFSLVSLNVSPATFSRCTQAILPPLKYDIEVALHPSTPVLNTVQWHCVGWMLVLEAARHSRRWRYSRWILDDIQQLRYTLEQLHSTNADWQRSECLQASSHRSAHSVSGLLNAWYTWRWCSVSQPSQPTQFCVYKHTRTVPGSVVWRR